MKLGYFFVAPVIFACCFSTFVQAEDKAADRAEARAREGKHEYRMRVEKRGNRFVGIHENREYVLRGDIGARFTTDGDYIVRGDISPDGTYIETNEFEPAGVRVSVGSHEFRMRVTHDHDRYIGHYDNREYILRGDAVSHITADGEYVIHGDIGPDNTYITTTDVAPVEVHEVIIEKKREPFIKVGPLEIGR